MSPRIERTPQARLDVIDQYLWYVKESGEALAERFIALAQETYQEIAEQPGLGRVRIPKESDLPSAGIRSWKVKRPFGNVLIFYFPTQHGILISRVLRGERDIDALFSQETHDK